MSGATYLYIIGEAEPCLNVKIGVSGNPWSRCTELQAGHHSKLVIHRTFMFPTRAKALAAEQKAHEFFEDAGMYGEWFGITPNEAIEGIEEAPAWPVSAP